MRTSLRRLPPALVFLLTLTLLPAGSLGGGAIASSPGDAIELRPGQPAFWEGRFADGGVFAPPGVSIARLPCDGVAVRCIDYALRVAEGGARLRVALDQRYNGDAYELTLVAPDGAAHQAPWMRPDMSGYSLEVLVDEPAPGAWVARVHQRAYDTGEFRMRAKLEHAPTPLPPDTVLLPNLQPDAPFAPEFGPCLPDEVLETGAQRCLRFDFAWGNAGAGTYEVRYAADGALDGSVVQRVYRADGTWFERPAGHARFHATHGHWHYEGFVAVELLRVLDPATGALSGPVSSGAKLGVCGHDWRIVDWHRFYQAPTGAADSPDECVAGPLYTNGLSAGWADAYWSGQPGNFIDFGANGDGEYVLRMTLDEDARLLESDETDNVGYTHIVVAGDAVTVLERGLGTDPWDPNKDPRPVAP